MRIKTYITSGGKDLIIEYIEELPKYEMLQGFAILKRLKQYGKDALEGLDTRQIQGKLWEIKFYRHNRIFYFTIQQNCVYLVHACKKQKGKAEKFEIETALKRMKETQIEGRD